MSVRIPIFVTYGEKSQATRPDNYQQLYKYDDLSSMTSLV